MYISAAIALTWFANDTESIAFMRILSVVKHMFMVRN